MGFISENKNNNIVLLIIWLLIYLSIIPMQLSNYVLCIGADGHVEFEIGINGRCANTSNFHLDQTEDVIATTGGENHCGSCIDLTIFVPLNTGLYLVPIQNSPTPIAALVAASLTDQTSDSAILPHIRLLDVPSIADPTLISLRNTILLI